MTTVPPPPAPQPSSPGRIVRVQHHPSRTEHLDRLTRNLRSYEIVVDPRPGAKKPSAWRTYLECLTRPTDAEWVVVIQDDAVAADGFDDALDVILPEHPGCLVVLFVAGAPLALARDIRNAHARGDRYVTAARVSWVPTVAVAWPTALRTHFVEWARRRDIPADNIGDDNVVGRWAKQMLPPVVVTVPSIVQHPDDMPSLFRKHASAGANPMRVAAVWTGTARYDWTLIPA